MSKGSYHQPRFVMERQYSAIPRKAIEDGKTVRERHWNGWVIYTPLRIKPRYWTSQTLNGSVIHIATGRGILTQGDVATSGWIHVEPYCSGRLTWPRSLSSPADFPERRLCGPCVEKAHTAELGKPQDPQPEGALYLVIPVHRAAA